MPSRQEQHERHRDEAESEDEGGDVVVRVLGERPETRGLGVRGEMRGLPVEETWSDRVGADAEEQGLRGETTGVDDEEIQPALEGADEPVEGKPERDEREASERRSDRQTWHEHEHRGGEREGGEVRAAKEDRQSTNDQRRRRLDPIGAARSRGAIGHAEREQEQEERGEMVWVAERANEHGVRQAEGAGLEGNEARRACEGERARSEDDAAGESKDEGVILVEQGPERAKHGRRRGDGEDLPRCGGPNQEREEARREHERGHERGRAPRAEREREREREGLLRAKVDGEGRGREWQEDEQDKRGRSSCGTSAQGASSGCTPTRLVPPRCEKYTTNLPSGDKQGWMAPLSSGQARFQGGVVTTALRAPVAVSITKT